MTFWQVLVMGLIQGATELFPVSSLGHAVILPSLLRWDFRQSDPTFIPFLVLLHLGTATALLLLYRSQWRAITVGFFRAAVRGRIENEDERMSFLLVAGTVPTALVAVVLQNPIRALFSDPRAAAGFLVANGLILFGAELLRRRARRRAQVAGPVRLEQVERVEPGAAAPAAPAAAPALAGIRKLGFREAILVGLCQSLALLPGISRSGITMAGGLVAGLSHEEAAHFSFLLATPIIAAAGVSEVPALFAANVPVAAYLAGAVLAGLAAYASARFLIRWFRVGRLEPYALYCVVAGAGSLLLLR